MFPLLATTGFLYVRAIAVRTLPRISPAALTHGPRNQGSNVWNRTERLPSLE